MQLFANLTLEAVILREMLAKVSKPRPSAGNCPSVNVSFSQDVIRLRNVLRGRTVLTNNGKCARSVYLEFLRLNAAWAFIRQFETIVAH